MSDGQSGDHLQFSVLVQFLMFLFCRAWMAFVRFRRVRGLMLFLSFLKFIIARLAPPDRRESRLLENCFALPSQRTVSFDSLLLAKHHLPSVHSSSVDRGAGDYLSL
jgi:hypothetical protein